MKFRLMSLALLGVGFSALSAWSQGKLESGQLDRTVLPIEESKYPPITELDARNAKAPPRFDVQAPKIAPNVVIILIDDIGFRHSQVIGTVFKTEYELKNDKPTFTIRPEIGLIDDRAGKPVAIHHLIGRVPIMCFGNSDGDHEMLQLTTIGRKSSFGLIVHHTDSDREYAYDAKPKSSGELIEALAAAPGRGWAVVDMKNDLKHVLSTFK